MHKFIKSPSRNYKRRRNGSGAAKSMRNAFLLLQAQVKAFPKTSLVSKKYFQYFERLAGAKKYHTPKRLIMIKPIPKNGLIKGERNG